MLAKILPDYLMTVIEYRLNLELLYELRLRTGQPICINYNGKYTYLTRSGISNDPAVGIVCDSRTIGDIVSRATEYSLYAHNRQLSSGYLTIVGGIRLGVSGEIVYNGDQIRTIKHFQALTIRVPHAVTNCAFEAFRYILDLEPRSTLIVSPPGAGKTTYIRDIARLFGDQTSIYNVLLVDERSEIAAVCNGVPQLPVGRHTDVISNCSKSYAFVHGIRSMRPDIIITDEIASRQDIEAIEYALTCGVRVIATTHARDHLEALTKNGFESIVSRKLFARYINLSSARGPGTCDGIFDANLTPLYYP